MQTKVLLFALGNVAWMIQKNQRLKSFPVSPPGDHLPDPLAHAIVSAPQKVKTTHPRFLA